MNSSLWLVALAVVLINLPFGFWRQGTRKFSPMWFVAVHAPIPAVVALRIVSGLGFNPVTFPVIVGAYFAGQYFGGIIRKRMGSPS
jgi:hypothetical protein